MGLLATMQVSTGQPGSMETVVHIRVEERSEAGQRSKCFPKEEERVGIAKEGALLYTPGP